MRPAANVAVLVALAAIAVGVGLVATGWYWGESPLVPAAVAAGLCLSSAIATLLLGDAVTRHAPELGPVAVLVSTGVRMAVAVIGVALLGEVLARHGTPRDQFAGWVAYLYIVTLAIECGLWIAGVNRAESGRRRES